MAFSPLFSGVALPRGTHYKTITLMDYKNRIGNPPYCPARKYCYIVHCCDLQKIFANAGVTLVSTVYNMHSFWNRRHPKQGEEYGIEICVDDDSNPNCYKDPWYLVYDKHWFHGNAEAQHKIYSDKITQAKAISLDKELRKHDVL